MKRSVVVITAIWLLAFCVSAQAADACSGQTIPPEFQKHCQAIAANPRDSLAHYRIGEEHFRQDNLQAAANSYRDALNGNLEPKWIEVWAHISLAKIFAFTEQNDRALNELKQALRTGAEDQGALDEAKRLVEELGGVFPGRSVPEPPRIAEYLVAEPVGLVPAEYTKEARAAELEGVVLLQGSIGEDGTARDLAVLRPLGLGLDEMAVKAAKEWLFAPAVTEGERFPVRRVISVDYSLPAKRSRWHLVGIAFAPPAGVAQPKIISATYPPGVGILIGGERRDHASVLPIIGRPATVVLAFEIDESGHPANIRVEEASDPMWGKQASAVVAPWRFQPGIKDGKAFPVQCFVHLIWGPRILKPATADRFSTVSKRRIE